MVRRLADAAREVHARGKRAFGRWGRHAARTREGHVSVPSLPCPGAIALGVLPTQAGAQSPPAPEVLRVTRTADDDGEGSLRWAIERNNAAPGRLRIEL